MNARRLVSALTVAVVLGAGPLACFGGQVFLPPPESGAVAVSSETALALRKRAEGFYLRLAHRRFNSLETFNDFILRDHFRTEDLFYDYYADLAQDLEAADFEKSRPFEVDVQEFLFEDVSNAKVRIRFDGWDDRPLRPGTTELERIDRWEFAEGTWWIRPGRL